MPIQQGRSTWRATLPAVLSALLLLTLVACSGGPDGPVSALHHFRKGNEAYAIEDYERAIRHFRFAAELGEGAAEIQYNLGLSYLRTDNLSEAVAAFQDALRLNPAMPDAHYNLALAYDRLYQPNAAHSHFNAYRAMVSGRTETPQDTGDLAKPALAAGAGAASVLGARPRTPPGQPPALRGGALPAAKRAARVGASTTVGGTPPARRAPGGAPMGRHTPPPPIPEVKDTQPGDAEKWWTQDKFIRKP